MTLLFPESLQAHVCTLAFLLVLSAPSSLLPLPFSLFFLTHTQTHTHKHRHWRFGLKPHFACHKDLILLLFRSACSPCCLACAHLPEGHVILWLVVNLVAVFFLLVCFSAFQTCLLLLHDLFVRSHQLMFE